MTVRSTVTRAILVLAVIMSACSGDAAGPEEVITQQTVEVTNVFAEEIAAVRPAPPTPSGLSSSLAEPVEIRRIRVSVYEVPGGALLFQKVYDVDPTKTRWTLPFEAPLGATVRLVSELMSVTNGVEKVEYSGQAGPITLTPCEPTCAPVPVRNYPGPVQNLDATSVTVSPAADTIAVDGATQLGATVAPAGPAYEPVWTSLDSTVARVSSTGLVTGRADGFARIVVAVGQRRDTAVITVGQATCSTASLAVGTNITGRWDGTDCIIEGVLTDRYSLTLGAQTTVTTTLSSAAVPKYTGMFNGGREIVNYVRSSAGDLQVNWFLAPGTYEFRTGAPVAGEGTPYSLTTASGGTSIGCATNATSGGITLDGQNLGPGDCTFGNRYEDRLAVYVEAGRDIVASMDAGFGHAVIIRDPATTPGMFLIRETRESGSVTASWRVTTAGYYLVIFSTMAENATGTYSGSVSIN